MKKYKMHKKIKNFPVQISEAIYDTKDLSINLDKIHRIVIAGMGGSAMAGLIMRDISPELEIIVERNYFPNAIIDEGTLLIMCSYSGDTEETLSYYQHASSFTKNIFGITSGGKLLELLKSDNHDYHILPEGYPPRSILGYTLTVLIKLLDGDELLKLLSIDLLQDYSNKFSLEDSEIFSIAKKIHSTFPVIVTEEDLFSIGYRLKCQLNENSKMLSYNITLPEMNHNELVGWDSKMIDKDLFSLIWIDITFPANIKRMDITNKMLSNKNSYSHHIQVPDDLKNDLTGLFYLINYIDWLSYWCGHLNDINIDTIESIDILKEKLA
tara:strand:- start:155 stop:1129 length:975 start_codon:yes stop_codon:yes gene_type:complete